MAKKRSQWDIPNGSTWEFSRPPEHNVEVGVVHGKFKVQDEKFMVNLRDAEGASLGNIPVRDLLRKVRAKREARPEESELLK